MKIRVFKGNEIDHKTVNVQIKTIKKEFNAESIILVGDKGMKIRLNLEELTEEEKLGVSYN